MINFIPMGYVSIRKGARLHLDVDGVAVCKSGNKTIITSELLTSESARKVCRHCVERLRTALIWRRQDASKYRTSLLSAECREIDALFDALDALEPGMLEQREALFAGIRANMLRAVHETSTPSVTEIDQDSNCRLF